jgi:hypothetical protein
MEGNADVLTTSNSEGIKKVIDSDGDFAYFLESPSAEYQVSKNCGITTVGGLLNTNGYGIALPQGKRSNLVGEATSMSGTVLLNHLLYDIFIHLIICRISIQRGSKHCPSATKRGWHTGQDKDEMVEQRESNL